MSRSSSGSGLRTGRAGAGCEEVEPDVEPPVGELLGPLVGHECGEVGVAGVCGADCDGTVRTGSPPCGRAELVVPAPGRPSVGAAPGRCRRSEPAESWPGPPGCPGPAEPDRRSAPRCPARTRPAPRCPDPRPADRMRTGLRQADLPAADPAARSQADRTADRFVPAGSSSRTSGPSTTHRSPGAWSVGGPSSSPAHGASASRRRTRPRSR